MHNIEFFACNNKEISYTFSFYYIIGEHESEGAIKIKK